jgi:hypothetical protein
MVTPSSVAFVIVVLFFAVTCPRRPLLRLALPSGECRRLPLGNSYWLTNFAIPLCGLFR